MRNDLKPNILRDNRLKGRKHAKIRLNAYALSMGGCFALDVLWLLVICVFLTVPWIGLQFVIVPFPGHIHEPIHGVLLLIAYGQMPPLNAYADADDQS